MLLRINCIKWCVIFSAPSTIDGVSDITITLVASVRRCRTRKSNSIKLRSPLDFASQGRAVTLDDYAVYARKLFPNTITVSVFGGEDGSLTHQLEYHLFQSMVKFLYQSKFNRTQSIRRTEISTRK